MTDNAIDDQQARIDDQWLRIVDRQPTTDDRDVCGSWTYVVWIEIETSLSFQKTICSASNSLRSIASTEKPLHMYLKSSICFSALVQIGHYSKQSNIQFLSRILHIISPLFLLSLFSWKRRTSKLSGDLNKSHVQEIIPTINNFSRIRWEKVYTFRRLFVWNLLLWGSEKTKYPRSEDYLLENFC